MASMIAPMGAMVLPPDLEQFAAEIAANGQYRDAADVVRASLDLLRRRDTARSEFMASLEAAQRDGERNGFHSLDDVLAELDDIIRDEERAQA